MGGEIAIADILRSCTPGCHYERSEESRPDVSLSIRRSRARRLAVTKMIPLFRRRRGLELLHFRRGLFDLTPLSCRFAVETVELRSAAEPQRGALTNPRPAAWVGDVGSFGLVSPERAE